MDSYRSIIDAWPSIAIFAADIDVDASHARTMKTRNSIPAPYWDAIIRAAKSREILGVSADVLMGLSRPKAPPRPKNVANRNRSQHQNYSTKRSVRARGA